MGTNKVSESIPAVEGKDAARAGIRPTRLYKSMARSRVTNGKSILPRIVDGRTLWARRARDLLAVHTADLGGDSNISEAERAILRRAVCLIIELEQLEVKFSTEGSKGYQLDRYQRVSNTLRRLLESLGLQRRARDITTPPTVEEYVRHLNEQEEDDA
jgi:hypothetical protein